MSFTLCTSQAIVTKAGVNVNAKASVSGMILEQFSDEAEATTSAMSRYDWVTNFATANANTKLILSDVASSLGAINLINYDMSGYTSRSEAETMLDVLRDNAMRGLSLIRDQKVVTLIK